VARVDIFDVNEHQAKDVAGNTAMTALRGGFSMLATKRLRAGSQRYQAAVSCVTYAYNPGLTRAAIKAGCHLVDLGGNNDVVNAQLAMDSVAAKRAS